MPAEVALGHEERAAQHPVAGKRRRPPGFWNFHLHHRGLPEEHPQEAWIADAGFRCAQHAGVLLDASNGKGFCFDLFS